MVEREVDWHEGMFLHPQHFQALMRHQTQHMGRHVRCDLYHHWGLRSIDLDENALGNHRFVVRGLEARLRDGTPLVVPEDGVLPVLDLKQAFERANQLTVYLAVPVLLLGRANVADADGAGRGARYRADAIEMEDEGTGTNPQRVKVRQLNLRLLLSTDDHTGYEVLPIARVVKAARADALPELDATYFPPLLACNAWKPLQAGILQAVFDRVGKKIELLASQATSRNVTFDSQGQGDRLLLTQLAELNVVSTSLGALAFGAGVHPQPVYSELARAVGHLAVFGAARAAPTLPPYDHDDLGTCFYRVKQHLDDLLNIFVEPEYKERPFVGAGLRMQVALEPVWLESMWQMFVGVQSRLEPDECINLLTKSGQLDMKIGSSDRVDAIYRLGQAGLKFDYVQRPPRALPAQPGLIYFEINREARLEEWQNVQKSLTLAVRLNENLIVGNIQGQTVLTIRTVGQQTTLQFTLYVAPRKT